MAKEKGVFVRVSPADYRKLELAAERNGATVSGEVRGRLVESLRWNDHGERIASEVKTTLTSIARAMVPALLDEVKDHFTEQAQSGKSSGAQAPADNTPSQPPERDWTLPITSADLEPVNWQEAARRNAPIVTQGPGTRRRPPP